MFNSNPPFSNSKSDQQVAAQVHNPFGLSDQQVVRNGLVPNQQGVFGVPQQNIFSQQQVQSSPLFYPPVPGQYPPPNNMFGSSNAMNAMMSNSVNVPPPYGSNAVAAMMSNSNVGVGYGGMFPGYGFSAMPVLNPAFGADPYP